MPILFTHEDPRREIASAPWSVRTTEPIRRRSIAPCLLESSKLFCIVLPVDFPESADCHTHTQTHHHTYTYKHIHICTQTFKYKQNYCITLISTFTVPLINKIEFFSISITEYIYFQSYYIWYY